MAGRVKEQAKVVEHSRWKYKVGEDLVDRTGRVWTVDKQALIANSEPIYFCRCGSDEVAWITEKGVRPWFRH